MTETERFFLPFIDKIERLNSLKNWKSYRNLTEKFYFEYHIIETQDNEPAFQVLFDFNWGHVQDRIFLASDYELFEARIEWIRDIFWAMR